MDDVERGSVRGVSEFTARVNAIYEGEKPLNTGNVRKTLSQISGNTMWRKMVMELGAGRRRKNAICNKL